MKTRVALEGQNTVRSSDRFETVQN